MVGELPHWEGLSREHQGADGVVVGDTASEKGIFLLVLVSGVASQCPASLGCCGHSGAGHEGSF